MTTEDQNVQVSVLAEALRQALNPSMNERLQLQERPEGAPHERIHCISPTGAEFDAVVACSKTHPHFGRVKSLENYRYPPYFHFGERDGAGGAVMSRVIDGKTREFGGKIVPLGNAHKMSLTRATWNRDLATYVGKELDVTIRADLQPRIKEIEAQLMKELAEKTAAITGETVPAAVTPAAPEAKPKTK